MGSALSHFFLPSFSSSMSELPSKNAHLVAQSFLLTAVLGIRVRDPLRTSNYVLRNVGV